MMKLSGERFSTRAELRQDFTSTTSEIADALVFTNPDGSTSLLDGVNLGLGHKKRAHTPRRALVVVSDGGDNNSRYTLSEPLARAKEADGLIYTICLFQDPQTTEELGGLPCSPISHKRQEASRSLSRIRRRAAWTSDWEK